MNEVETYFADPKGIETSAFRRNGIQKFQRYFVLILMLLSCAALILTLVGCSLDQLVFYSVNKSVVYVDGSYRVELIPQTQVDIGFVTSCVNFRCFSRGSIEVPDLFNTGDVIESNVHVDKYVYFSYAAAKRFFNVGFNFGEACASHKEEGSPRSTSQMAIAMLILVILTLFFILVGCCVLFRQLSNPNSYYHKLHREYLVCDTSIAPAYLDSVVRVILWEERVVRYSTRVFVVCGFLTFAFSLCSLCGSLMLYWRPGCTKGFCSAFQRAMTVLGNQKNVSPPNTTCRYGITIYLTITIFVLAATLFILILGFLFHVWRDNSARKVNEAIQYLVGLQHSLASPHTSLHGYDNGSIMLHIAQQMREEEEQERSRRTDFFLRETYSRVLVDEVKKSEANTSFFDDLQEGPCRRDSSDVSIGRERRPNHRSRPEANIITSAEVNSLFAAEREMRECIQKERDVGLRKLKHRLMGVKNSSRSRHKRKGASNSSGQGESASPTRRHGSSRSRTENKESDAVQPPGPSPERRGRRRKKLYDSHSQ